MQHPGLCFLGARGVTSDPARQAFAVLAALYHLNNAQAHFNPGHVW
jgi:hypothetical protein